MPEPRHSFGVHSEYGRLREVVVGRPDELFFPPWSKEFSHYNAEFTSALKDRQDDRLSHELDAAKRHIGELSMENELLRERSRAAEGRLPLATRRLRR